ncbi:unnamed protein product, partial [Brenthis ino]
MQSIRPRSSTCKRSEPRSEVKLHNRKSSSNSDHRIPKHAMFGASQGGTITVSDCPNTLNEVNENDILTETYVVKNLKEKKFDDYDSDVTVISEVMPVKIHKHNIVLQKPMITININGLSLSVLVDSGSEVNIISSDIYDAIGKPKCNKDNITLSGIGLSTVRSIGKCYLSFYADGNYYSNIVFHIVSKNYIPYNVILGQEFLSNITVVMERGCVRLVCKERMQMGCCVNECLPSYFIGPIRNIRLRKKVMQHVKNYNPKQSKQHKIISIEACMIVLLLLFFTTVIFNR